MPEPTFDSHVFADLKDPAGLARLEERFLAEIRTVHPELHTTLLAWRDGQGPSGAKECDFLIELAQVLEAFLAPLFGIDAELDRIRTSTLEAGYVGIFKREFIPRLRRYRGELGEFQPLDAARRARFGDLAGPPLEQAIAAQVVHWLEDEPAHAAELEEISRWCLAAQRTPEGAPLLADWRSLDKPVRVDFSELVSLVPVPGDTASRVEAPELRQRDGFALTDTRMNLPAVMDEIHYCMWCHTHKGDYCSTGFPVKKGATELKDNPLGVTLTGCPLEERISEMHQLKAEGFTLGALAIAMADNPMIPATGHRICNDCMKACIYQKQAPVNIPEVETRVLTDVLHLPWGVEIYHLLTRWNPLRRKQYLAAPDNGRRVLVSGMGPAGFTMAHHLTMEGCAVVGIDGLKIEPLPAELLDRPIRDYASLEESLDERILAGFGGVAEYGITVRWDKNFLKLVYLTLARRDNFAAFGGVRLGGTITVPDAWGLGFDHVCIANGAGLPRVIPMENSLARGMRQASDFLMALQLTGAAKRSSLASLQVRLPAVVIGGGLTAVDTATEVQAYYLRQVEKTLERYEILAAARGDDSVRRFLDEENNTILDEFLEHGRAVRAERERAATAGEAPDFISLARGFGGVTLTYRRSMKESPAYLRNHEEITKAMEEGIFYAEGLEPVRAELDAHQHIRALVCRRKQRAEDGRWKDSGEEITLPARAVFVAAGASPNTIYEQEYPGNFEMQGNHFRPHERGDGVPVAVPVAPNCKSEKPGPLTSYTENGHRVSFIGDTHPVYHGSVVKAIASASRSYPDVMASVATAPADRRTAAAFIAGLADVLTPKVERIDTTNPAVVELWVRAPLAASNFKPGQFFRLQTFESTSPVVAGTRLQVPLQTVSGAGVKGDCVRLMVLRMGTNPRLIERLKPGDPLVLMGPTGAPAELHPDRTILVVAGKWGAAVMLDLGPAARAAGSRVLMFGAFGRREELYHREELEAGCDQIVWCTARGETIPALRPQDHSVSGGNVIEILERYDEGAYGDGITLKEVDEIWVMGSTGLLMGLQSALKGELGTRFREDVEVLGTVGSPMQCMLKGVCAQCLQWQVDPATGQRTQAVFSCARQDQPLFAIDLENLAARQAQNRLPDMLSAQWLDYVLEQEGKGP
ncbi:MAG: pyridine nucleotide-disulfide oxidoreductase [Gammaproteobacteria bacterium]|nr:pyridine nucleotide-disulfide oxidoreductase [Gammaproteobacteria bacterium]